MHKIVLPMNAAFGTMGTERTDGAPRGFGCSDLSPPPSSFGVDLRGSSEPRFFCQLLRLVRVLQSVGVIPGRDSDDWD